MCRTVGSLGGGCQQEQVPSLLNDEVELQANLHNIRAEKRKSTHYDQYQEDLQDKVHLAVKVGVQTYISKSSATSSKLCQGCHNAIKGCVWRCMDCVVPRWSMCEGCISRAHGDHHFHELQVCEEGETSFKLAPATKKPLLPPPSTCSSCGYLAACRAQGEHNL